jgi:ATP-dependent HslUV protease subunit HslV
MSSKPRWRRTTVLAVRRNGKVVVASDGQVTLDKAVVKDGAKKVRRVGEGKVLAGFAGGAADAFALLTRFEEKLSAHSGKLERAAVELVREWRTDRALRQLQAMLIVADKEKTLLLSGTGDLIEPDDGILGIGSGSIPAMSAARALMAHTEMDAREIVEASMKVAASIDIYTNNHLTVEEI